MPHTAGEPRDATHAMRFNREVWSEECTSSGCLALDDDGFVSRREHLFELRGHDDATNQVLHLPARAQDSWGNLVAFPGDIQHLRHRMVADGHGDFSEYCLENFACTLADKFPGHAVWVVLPKTHVHGVLASYDNFVKADWDSGGAVLEYLPDGSACEHLEALLNSAADAVQSLPHNGACAEPDMSLPLTLVGFSKGAVVLNQLVTELASGAAMSPRTPNGGSMCGDSRDNGEPVRFVNNRKRSRVSKPSNRDCGGGERLASSEGSLTNPPSPADETSSPSWEGGRDSEGNTCSESSEQDGSPIRRHQGTIGSLWSRICSTFGMSRDRFSTRPLCSTSLGASARKSPSPNQQDGILDGGGGPGWKDTETDQNQFSPGSSSSRSASSTRRTRKRACDDTGSNTDGREDDKSNYPCPAGRLFNRVAGIHWVDGGNGHLAGGSFPTNMSSLARLAALPNLAIRVHGTPYQWGSHCRPFLAVEADAFVTAVESFRPTSNVRERSPFATTMTKSSTSRGTAVGDAKEACDVKRLVYFESEQPSLENHFRVLRELNTE